MSHVVARVLHDRAGRRLPMVANVGASGPPWLGVVQSEGDDWRATSTVFEAQYLGLFPSLDEAVAALAMHAHRSSTTRERYWLRSRAALNAPAKQLAPPPPPEESAIW